MKSLGGGGAIKEGVIPTKTEITVEQARRFAWSLPIATLVCGIDSMEVLDQDLSMARNFEPMSDVERSKLADRYERIAGDGRYEYFKSTKFYDGPYHQEQHGFDVKVQV